MSATFPKADTVAADVDGKAVAGAAVRGVAEDGDAAATYVWGRHQGRGGKARGEELRLQVPLMRARRRRGGRGGGGRASRSTRAGSVASYDDGSSSSSSSEASTDSEADGGGGALRRVLEDRLPGHVLRLRLQVWDRATGSLLGVTEVPLSDVVAGSPDSIDRLFEESLPLSNAALLGASAGELYVSARFELPEDVKGKAAKMLGMEDVRAKSYRAPKEIVTADDYGDGSAEGKVGEEKA